MAQKTEVFLALEIQHLKAAFRSLLKRKGGKWNDRDDEEHGEFRRKQRLKPRLFNHGVATLDIL